MLLFLYSITLLLLSIYSYSQIDLNLTLSQNSFYQSFQQILIQLGYYNRPLSALIYGLLLLFMFFLYLYCLNFWKKIKKTDFFRIIFLIGFITFFSYPAFSHDIFNYMFDARIVTKHAANPYVTSALDFRNDLWTRFMHWTHRTYPYGPIWLILTLPFSFAGLGKFVLTLLNFKLIFLAFYLGNIYLIRKIVVNSKPEMANAAVIFYALNPLIIIESLISPHNETAMVFFLFLALYFALVKKKFFTGILNLSLSVGIKFVTITALPVFFLYWKFRNKIKNDYYLFIIFLSLIPPLILEIILREPYPWYFIPITGIGSLLIYHEIIALLIISVSIGAMLRYLPYLYSGEYTQNNYFWANLFFILPIVFVSLFILIKRRYFMPLRLNTPPLEVGMKGRGHPANPPAGGEVG